jgi:hypothetical protein
VITVVQFHPTDSTGNWKNKLWTRTLRKIGFVDNRYTGPAKPEPGEDWLVEVLRENQGRKAPPSTDGRSGGGCLILRPIRKLEQKELLPLIHGMYELRTEEDIVILTPHDKAKFWVISPQTKNAILATTKANTIIIDHGGNLWPRRKSAESLLEQEASKLLKP